MAKDRMQTLLRLLGLQRSMLPDVELLDRFAVHRDEAALWPPLLLPDAVSRRQGDLLVGSQRCTKSVSFEKLAEPGALAP
jgi:hypothetical protein